MTTLTSRHTGIAATALRPTALIGRVFALLGLYQSRRSLARLDDTLLADIGLTRDEATREAHRAVWHVPACWRS
ncbi:DUF1127 domain-containing protein [Pseudooceanicola sp.]|uniref:DUF1127 domain-containing protein n=1 Tax=Pseudooceanicola sp. TaxID=1914328 RepID=UPI002621B305|nr:DUF1127 domain-containing protein [Pseudooceanicola sp.]MDF1855236.1 DUF1127 domain-containing protein [Pseudooceanicola sp.]